MATKIDYTTLNVGDKVNVINSEYSTVKSGIVHFIGAEMIWIIPDQAYWQSTGHGTEKTDRTSKAYFPGELEAL